MLLHLEIELFSFTGAAPSPLVKERGSCLLNSVIVRVVSSATFPWLAHTNNIILPPLFLLSTIKFANFPLGAERGCGNTDMACGRSSDQDIGIPFHTKSNQEIGFQQKQNKESIFFIFTSISNSNQSNHHEPLDKTRLKPKTQAHKLQLQLIIAGTTQWFGSAILNDGQGVAVDRINSTASCWELCKFKKFMPFSSNCGATIVNFDLQKVLKYKLGAILKPASKPWVPKCQIMREPKDLFVNCHPSRHCGSIQSSFMRFLGANFSSG